MNWRKFFRRERADADLVEEIKGHMAEDCAQTGPVLARLLLGGSPQAMVV